jgi:probable HAF family extracellular repeat protein
MKRNRQLLIALALTGSTIVSAQAPRYNVIELSPSTVNSEAFDINNRGQVVGRFFNTQTGQYQAALWNQNRLVPLGTGGSQFSTALGINDSGIVVGMQHRSAARLFASTSPQSFLGLGTLGGQESLAVGINNSGLIVGRGQLANGDWRAFRNGRSYQPGIVAYPTLGGKWAYGFEVNDSAETIGHSMTRSGPSHATVWSRQWPNGLDLGTLGGPQSEGWSNNQQGVGVGWSDLVERHVTPSNRGNIKEAFWTPYRSQNRRLRSLGQLFRSRPYPLRQGNYRFFNYNLRIGEITRPTNICGIDTFAHDINRSNVIAGSALLYTLPSGSQRRATVWTGGRWYDLNECISPGAGWYLEVAWAINDQGWIVGRGFGPGGTRAFLLVPVSSPQP